MRIEESETDIVSLEEFGIEALKLICTADFGTLGKRFGYLRAFERNIAVALEADLNSSLEDLGATERLNGAAQRSVVVKYLDPNDIALFAVVECRVMTNSGKSILLELVVSGGVNERQLWIEDISGEN